MDVRTAPAIAEALHRAVDLSDFGYAGDPAPVVEAFASFARDAWGWETTAGPDRVRTFADVGQAGREILAALTAPGDAIIINPPVYLSFYGWLHNIGRRPLEVPALQGDSPGALDLEGMERAFASGARVALLCSPHNPYGYVYSQEELAALADLAVRYDAVVVSDEIHAPLVHPSSPRPFVPFLTVSDAARQVGIALHSPSKAWNVAGLKLAVGVTADSARWPEVPELDWSPSIMGQYSAVAAYTDSRDWLAATITELEQRTAQLVDTLAEHLPQVGYRPGHASYLAWLDCRELRLGDDPSQVFAERGRVQLSPGPAFGSGGQGFARLNIGTSEELMVEAVRRMAASLD